MGVEPTESEWNNFRQLVELAREEDLGTGDLTGRLLPAELQARGRFVARQPLIFCGGVFLDGVAQAYNEKIETTVRTPEGKSVEAGDVLGEWAGPAWAIMAAERVALNFLQRLGGIATATRKFVNAVAGTGTSIYDTRKTAPGWRHLEKYAVRVGGAKNHRRGLYDAVMVKDNHLAALGCAGDTGTMEYIATRLEQFREQLGHDGFIEIEVDRLDQLSAALKLPVDVILLDNMAPARLRRAVEMRNSAGLAGKVALEASGGITLRAVPAVAESGVERISLGSITHSAGAVDIALDIELST